MRYTRRLSSTEALRPETYADRRVLYELVRDALLAARVTEPEVARRLAIAAVHHLEGRGGRVLLRSADGGEVALIRTFVELVDLPMVEINAGMLAEMNWTGSDLGFFLGQLYADLRLEYLPTAVPTIAEHACVFVHSLDSVRIPGTYTSVDATRNHREGQQQSLAALCGGGSIPVATGQGPGRTWRGDSALVVVAGRFDGLPAGRPDADDMIGWGLLPSLARALAGFSFLELPPASAARTERSVRDGVRLLQQRFLEFGFRLEVTDQAIRYVTNAVSAGRHSGGAAAASRWITDAAEAALLRLLEERAPVGARYTLARDDLTLPEVGRGFWRE